MKYILKEETVSTQICELICLSNQVFFAYTSSLFLEGSSALLVFILDLLVYSMYDQSNIIFFPLFVVQ
jgi:hypothetical protein